MTFDALDGMLALLPILIVLGLMVGRGWSTTRAGLVGWLAALALAAGRFGAGPETLAVAQIKGVILTLDVLLIIWSALLLYLLVDRAGMMAVITAYLSGLSADTLRQTLLIGWVFASFLQGIGGFGVPVAITAPLLIGLGVTRTQAVIIPSLGHGWAVTFGSLAAAFIMLVNTTDLPASRLAAESAVVLGVLCPLSGLMAAHALDSRRGVRRALPFVLGIGALMAITQVALAVAGVWTLSATAAALVGMVAGILWLRGRPADIPTPWPLSHVMERGNNPHTSQNGNSGEGLSQPPIRQALAGYTILVILALLLNLAPLKAPLARWALRINLPTTTTARGWTVPAVPDDGFGIPGHPGVIILYSSLITYLLYRRRGLYLRGAGRAILAQSGRGALRSGIGVFMMVAIAATMARSGMMEALAGNLSRHIPANLYAFVAPLLGALGAFVTGSNVNSNAVFGLLQQRTAEDLGLPAVTILAAQTAAASVSSVLAPAKVAVGSSTVGANEGQVLRRLLGYGAILVLLVGVLTWVRLTI